MNLKRHKRHVGTNMERNFSLKILKPIKKVKEYKEIYWINSGKSKIHGAGELESQKANLSFDYKFITSKRDY